jgi:mono/diheme cytochrome c family protein
MACVAFAGDAQRGSMILHNETFCLQCHSIRGEGNRTAPDLAQKLVSTYTPAALASVLWNHTPAMWNEMAARVVTRPLLTDAEWEDVFAYLYSLQFFDRPGDAKRGQKVFNDKECSSCHSVTLPSSGVGTGVPAWKMVDDPVALLEQMWNHATPMKGEIAEQRRQWKKLNGREFADLTAYVQSVQKIPEGEAAGKFSLPEPAGGVMPFETNCGLCHSAPTLAAGLRNQTWMDIGAGMWNHAPLMRTFPPISVDEMRKILAYVWELQYMGPPGNAARGQRVFEQKRCITCHNDGSTGAAKSPRPGKTFTPFSMVALGWSPGRQMHQAMMNKGVRWPYLSADDMSNLVAYLNTLH